MNRTYTTTRTTHVTASNGHREPAKVAAHGVIDVVATGANGMLIDAFLPHELAEHLLRLAHKAGLKIVYPQN